jgi:hypothetical protein
VLLIGWLACWIPREASEPEPSTLAIVGPTNSGFAYQGTES